MIYSATPVHSPSSPHELAEVLKETVARSKAIEIAGNRSKRLWGGPVNANSELISTAKLNRVIQAEPKDLTISVEAGMNFGELQSMLAREHQMIALDPPCCDTATVGGVLATGSSGPLRRGFGTARDLVIGMTFATLEGKLINSGGMVVKNVAGLDMAKLMIGSFGTLAVIVSANFRVHPLPENSLTIVTSHSDVGPAIHQRDAVLSSPLRPISVEILNPPAAARVGLRGFVLGFRAAGSRGVLARFANEIPHQFALQGSSEREFWDQVREFTPHFLSRQSDGAVLRVTTRLNGVEEVMRAAPGPAISRAGSGVTYLYLNSWQQGKALWKLAQKQGWHVVVEAAADSIREQHKLWFHPDQPAEFNTFALMQRLKSVFDPHGLLNPSRLYGRL